MQIFMKIFLFLCIVEYVFGTLYGYPDSITSNYQPYYTHGHISTVPMDYLHNTFVSALKDSAQKNLISVSEPLIPFLQRTGFNGVLPYAKSLPLIESTGETFFQSPTPIPFYRLEHFSNQATIIPSPTSTSFEPTENGHNDKHPNQSVIPSQSEGLTSNILSSSSIKLRSFSEQNSDNVIKENSIFEQAQSKPIITTHFYTHSAQEEEPEEAETSANIEGGPVHKHYRVVFIKAPHESAKSAALRIAESQNEEKTIIYVLSKKIDPSEIRAEISQTVNKINKPEVFFIKYRTAEEAAHAQQQIQAQYDTLGGTSEILDEGISPIHTVISGVLSDVKKLPTNQNVQLQETAPTLQEESSIGKLD